MAFCTQCGQPLTPGAKFCIKCGKRVPMAAAAPPPPPIMQSPAAPRVVPPPPIATPPATPRVAPPPPPTVPQAVVKPPTPAVRPVAKAASAATSMAKGANIMASKQKGDWVAASWTPTIQTSSSPLTAVKNFFTPQHKLAYAWFLLPVLTTMFTIGSYLFHLVGRLFA